MEIITKIEQATNEELLDENYIKENLLGGLCEIDAMANPQVKGLLKKLFTLYYTEKGEHIAELLVKIDSMLFKISCIDVTNEDAKIPECFEYPYFWHYFFATAFPLASDEDESLFDLISDQYPIVESWLEEVFKDEPLKLDLDDKTLTIEFHMDEVKYILGDEEVFALFDYDTLRRLTEDDEVLFMLLLPVTLNEPNTTIDKHLLEIVQEFPIYEGLHKKVTDLLVKHITTEVDG